MFEDPDIPGLVTAWLCARSICRGLPLPVADRGGLRVDTDLPAEMRRWVFAQPCDGLRSVAREVTSPRHPIKLSGPAGELMAALPAGWQLQSPGYLMTCRTPTEAARSLPPGHRLESARHGATAVARILAPDGSLAASGHAAEARGVFIYDRIVTAPEHRRKGLGNIVMNALKAHRTSASAPQLLVATDDGLGLYKTLGWTVISPFSTASIPG